MNKSESTVTIITAFKGNEDAFNQHLANPTFSLVLLKNMRQTNFEIRQFGIKSEVINIGTNLCDCCQVNCFKSQSVKLG